jgi:hypothetical protein
VDTEPPGAPAPKKRRYSSRRWGAVLGLIVLAAGVIGAVVLAQPAAEKPGSVHPSADRPVPNAVGSGYLANESGAVVFIQWTQSGQSVSGSTQVETLAGSPPNQSVSTDTISVAGRLSGSTITLSFNGGATVFGTLSGGSFTVNFPQTDGSLAPVTFTAATATQFNQALAVLQGHTGSANQSAAEAETVTSEQQSIDKWASAVEGDISGITQDVGTLTSDLGGFTQDLATAKADVATVAAEEQTVVTESQNGTNNDQVCEDSDTAQEDADTVGEDGDTVSETADTVETDLSRLRTDISGTQQDFASLQSAQTQQPSYRDGAPSQSAVDQAVAGANAAIASSLKTANGDVAQVNAYETQAYNDAVAAAQAGNCAGPATQFTQPDIT